MSNNMCLKLESCPKLALVLDHDLLEPQYVELIGVVCAKCRGGTTPRQRWRDSRERDKKRQREHETEARLVLV